MRNLEMWEIGECAGKLGKGRASAVGMPIVSELWRTETNLVVKANSTSVHSWPFSKKLNSIIYLFIHLLIHCSYYGNMLDLFQTFTHIWALCNH